MDDMFESMMSFLNFKKAMNPEKMIKGMLETMQYENLIKLREMINGRIKIISELRDISDPYCVLGIDADCTKKELENAYIQKAKEYHPDKGGSNEDMVNINIAYKTIKAQKGW